jgi:hypothetical protein
MWVREWQWFMQQSSAICAGVNKENLFLIRPLILSRWFAKSTWNSIHPQLWDQRVCSSWCYGLISQHDGHCAYGWNRSQGMASLTIAGWEATCCQYICCQGSGHTTCWSLVNCKVATGKSGFWKPWFECMTRW